LRPARLLAATLLVAATAAACSSGSGATYHPPSAGPSGAPPPAETMPSASPTPAAAHVFLIVMENRSYEEALSQPYAASLAATYAVATNYHAIGHPSLPNYLALSSGSTWGIADDGYHAIAGQGLGDELSAAGVSWRAYEDGMTRGCFQSPLPYVLHHNPFAYYGGACPASVVTGAQLDADLAGTTPRFSWIQPDNCESSHSCPVQDGDRWLSQVVPKITSSEAWKQAGVLFITWDEDDGSASNRVATLVVAPDLAAHQTAVAYDHYSLLATIEDRLGVPRLGRAARAQPMGDLLTG
jgi:phospholipase C